MDIKHFRTFRAIVELGSFSKAAIELNYSASTVTEHIQLLENDIGAPIFNRLGKKITLTSVGKDLYKHVLELFTVLDQIENVSFSNSLAKGTLKIGASESLIVYSFGDLIKKFRLKYPNVELILISDSCENLRNRLRLDEVDLILTLEPKVEHAELVTTYIQDEELVFISGVDAQYKAIDMGHNEALSELTYIFTEGNCALRKYFKAYLKSRNIQPRSELSFSSIEAIKHCVVNNLGISLLPKMSVSQLKESDMIQYVQVANERLTFTSQFSYHKDKWRSPLLEGFIELIKEEFL
jgi:DNA-binding transcriptional LysR family regulator